MEGAGDPGGRLRLRQILRKKAAFVSAAWFPDFANFRRDGYDFDARYDDGIAPFSDKFLFELIDGNAPVLSKRLKQLGDYGKDGRKGFDVTISRLQRLRNSCEKYRRRRCSMEKLTFFYLEDCPYCQNAKKALEELKGEKPEYGKGEIEWVEESQSPEIAERYDYYYVPAVYAGGRKLYEASPSEGYADCKERLRAALDAAR